MKKRRKLDLLDSFVKAYQLLITCMNAVSANDCTHSNCERFLKLQLTTTMLIGDFEKVIKQTGLYDEAFLDLKKELNECVKNHYKLSPKISLDAVSIETKLNTLKNEYSSYLNEI